MLTPFYKEQSAPPCAASLCLETTRADSTPRAANHVYRTRFVTIRCPPGYGDENAHFSQPAVARVRTCYRLGPALATC
jgi:hypothetical protein